MAAPWEKYQADKKPWEKFSQPQQTQASSSGPSQSYMGGIIDAVTKGATFGMGPKITAAEAALLGRTPEGDWFNYDQSMSERYNRALEAERAQNQSFGQQNPIASTAAEIGGGIASGSAALKGGLTAARVLPQTRMGQAAGMGIDSAAMGGTYAYGEDQNILEGAGQGALFGVGGKLAGDAVGAGVSKLKNVISGNFGDPGNQALTRIWQVAKAQGLDDATIRQKLSELGPEAFALDIMGEPGRQLARAAANVSPEAQQALEAASFSRMATQPDRMMSAVGRATGNTGQKSVDEIVQAAEKAQRPAIRNAYRQAEAAGYEMPSAPFRELKKSPAIADAMREAEGFIGNIKGANGSQWVSKLDFYDAAKRLLDDKASAAYRSGENYKAGVYADLARNLRETVDSLLPGTEYVDARSLAQTLFRTKDAIQKGAEGAKGRIPLDYAREVGRIDPNLKPYAAQGYGAQMSENIYQNRGTPGLPDRFFGSKASQDVMRALLPRGNADELMKAVNAERQFAQTHRGLTGNSTTARQLVQMGALPAGVGLTGLLGGMDPMTAGGAAVASALLRKGGGAVLARSRAANEQKVAPLVAQALLNRNIPPSQLAKMTDEQKQRLARILATGAITATYATGQ